MKKQIYQKKKLFYKIIKLQNFTNLLAKQFCAFNISQLPFYELKTTTITKLGAVTNPPEYRNLDQNII